MAWNARTLEVYSIVTPNLLRWVKFCLPYMRLAHFKSACAISDAFEKLKIRNLERFRRDRPACSCACTEGSTVVYWRWKRSCVGVFYLGDFHLLGKRELTGTVSLSYSCPCVTHVSVLIKRIISRKWVQRQLYVEIYFLIPGPFFF